ncbi:MAG TPA: S9 family peptidase [Pyrinomonadaceae bacterium]|jgi:dipeptidyl aminopeptidase/acylaminoacyl peptidase|nr:S9 family peptidase [Pyrinomonadaceae bacterium]
MIRTTGTFLTTKILLGALSSIFLLGATALAQKGLPPLIDREVLFGNPEIAGAQISPDGKFIAFRKPHKGTMNIWVKRADEPFASARLLTNEAKRAVRNYFWSRDGKFILFVKDKAGDENFNLYAVNLNEQPPSGEEVPVARNLTNSEKVRTIIYNVPRAEPDAVYVGMNDRDPAWHDLYKVKISTGERTLVRQNTERLTDWLFDNKDGLRLATRSTKSGDREVLRVDADGKFKTVYSCSVFETCNLNRFHKDNRRVYMISNKGAGVDLARLVLFDPETGKEEVVESDPLSRVDLDGAAFSTVTDELVFTGYIDDRQRLYFKDKALEKDYKFLQKKLPNREIYFDSTTADEMTWLILAVSDTEAGEKYLFDRKSKKLELQYRNREKLPREALAELKPIRYKSSDGLEIPAYLALPRGVAPKNLPTVILPHGGPWGRERWGYDSQTQFLANRGYAVLLPNFRGSTGYGKKFLDAGNGQWGERMQDDVTWGVKYLISQGITDPKRVGIMGASYGGYAALAGVTYTPDLYAAAVAINAQNDLISLLEAMPATMESERIRIYKRVGDPTTAEGKAQLVRQSPLTYADKIKTPLLIVQGANDVRVKKRQADQIVISLRERGFPVEYIVAPDEGHGFARPVNVIATLAMTEKFLAKYLGGRYQESMSPEVTKRLQEITVDPTTVKLATSPTGK